MKNTRITVGRRIASPNARFEVAVCVSVLDYEHCENLRRDYRLHRGGHYARHCCFVSPIASNQDAVSELIHQEKTTGLSSEEKSELDNYMQLEHLMRLAKARAHQYVANE